jgi:hypothetical protein
MEESKKGEPEGNGIEEWINPVSPWTANPSTSIPNHFHLLFPSYSPDIPMLPCWPHVSTSYTIHQIPLEAGGCVRTPCESQVATFGGFGGRC